MRAAIIAGLLAASSAAFACGYCVEDKIASAYDHTIVTRALAQKHHVAFFHIEGRVSPAEGTRKALEAAAYSVPAIDKGSVRIVLDTLTVSLSFDPGQLDLAGVAARLDRKLAGRRLSLMPFRVMEQPADLKAVKRQP